MKLQGPLEVTLVTEDGEWELEDRLLPAGLSLKVVERFPWPVLPSSTRRIAVRSRENIYHCWESDWEQATKKKVLGG